MASCAGIHVSNNGIMFCLNSSLGYTHGRTTYCLQAYGYSLVSYKRNRVYSVDVDTSIARIHWM